MHMETTDLERRQPPGQGGPLRAADDFDELVRRERVGLIAAAVAIVGSWHVAEEIVQDAVTSAHLRWGELRGFEQPGAWIRRVAVNRAIDRQRRNATEERYLRSTSGQVDNDDGSDPAESLGDDELWAAVRSLRPDAASALALRYGADLAIEDVAATLEVTIPAAQSLLYRARRDLRKILAEER